jgi:hypothetical protein
MSMKGKVMDINSLSLEACRDWLAEYEGWTKDGDEYTHPTADVRCYFPGCRYGDHPIPATLEEAAKLPEGWSVDITFLAHDGLWNVGIWLCRGDDGNPQIITMDADKCEMLSRFRVRVAAKMAENERSKR